MGQITEENRRKLEQADNYEDAAITDLIDNVFTEHLDHLFEEKRMSTQKIVEKTGLSKSYINKLRNRSEKKVRPDRYVIINIGLALNCTENEINSLLKAANLHPLYARSNKESIIIWGLLHNKNYEEILDLLDQKGFHRIFE